MLNFLKEKFDLLLVTAIFMTAFICWIHFGFNAELKEFVITTFGAFLAMLGLRPRPVPTNTANTETGDIVQTAPADPAKEKTNENVPLD